MQGASWQRCRVHFMRNALAKVSKGHAEMVVELGADLGRAGLGHDRPLEGEFPGVTQLLLGAKADLTAFADFALPHWRKISSTNPLEPLNREAKHRTDVVVVVVGIFSNPAALLRLSACVLIEAHDEWQTATAATCPKARWPCSTRRNHRDRDQEDSPQKTSRRTILARHSCPHSRSNTRRATPRRRTRSCRTAVERFVPRAEQANCWHGRRRRRAQPRPHERPPDARGPVRPDEEGALSDGLTWPTMADDDVEEHGAAHGQTALLRHRRNHRRRTCDYRVTRAVRPRSNHPATTPCTDGCAPQGARRLPRLARVRRRRATGRRLGLRTDKETWPTGFVSRRRHTTRRYWCAAGTTAVPERARVAPRPRGRERRAGMCTCRPPGGNDRPTARPHTDAPAAKPRSRCDHAGVIDSHVSGVTSRVQSAQLCCQ
jgi:hypothetical protein